MAQLRARGRHDRPALPPLHGADQLALSGLPRGVHPVRRGGHLGSGLRRAPLDGELDPTPGPLWGRAGFPSLGSRAVTSSADGGQCPGREGHRAGGREVAMPGRRPGWPAVLPTRPTDHPVCVAELCREPAPCPAQHGRRHPGPICLPHGWAEPLCPGPVPGHLLSGQAGCPVVS